MPVSTRLFTDLNTMDAVGLRQLAQRNRPDAKFPAGHFPSQEQLDLIGGAFLVDNNDGDVPTGKVVPVGDEYHREYRPSTQAEITRDESDWVSSELSAADKEVFKHDDAHGRTNSTIQAWRTYRNELRDYIVDDVIVTAKPSRPA